MRNLEAHHWILKDLLKVDQSQILSVLLQDLIIHHLYKQDHQLLCYQMPTLENHILDHLLVHLQEIDQYHLLLLKIKDHQDLVQNLVVEKALQDHLLDLDLHHPK